MWRRLDVFETKFKMASAVNGAKEEYGKVVISLENCLLPKEKLIQTPSMKDGLDKEVEIDLRIIGCEFIQASGILLKLPQVCTIASFRGLFLVAFERFTDLILLWKPPGSNGYWTSSISAFLLFKIIC